MSDNNYCTSGKRGVPPMDFSRINSNSSSSDSDVVIVKFAERNNLPENDIRSVRPEDVHMILRQIHEDHDLLTSEFKDGCMRYSKELNPKTKPGQRFEMGFVYDDLVLETCNLFTDPNDGDVVVVEMIRGNIVCDVSARQSPLRRVKSLDDLNKSLSINSRSLVKLATPFVDKMKIPHEYSDTIFSDHLDVHLTRHMTTLKKDLIIREKLTYGPSGKAYVKEETEKSPIYNPTVQPDSTDGYFAIQDADEMCKRCFLTDMWSKLNRPQKKWLGDIIDEELLLVREYYEPLSYGYCDENDPAPSPDCLSWGNCSGGSLNNMLIDGKCVNNKYLQGVEMMINNLKKYTMPEFTTEQIKWAVSARTRDESVDRNNIEGEKIEENTQEKDVEQDEVDKEHSEISDGVEVLSDNWTESSDKSLDDENNLKQSDSNHSADEIVQDSSHVLRLLEKEVKESWTRTEPIIAQVDTDNYDSYLQLNSFCVLFKEDIVLQKSQEDEQEDQDELDDQLSKSQRIMKAIEKCKAACLRICESRSTDEPASPLASSEPTSGDESSLSSESDLEIEETDPILSTNLTNEDKSVDESSTEERTSVTSTFIDDEFYETTLDDIETSQLGQKPSQENAKQVLLTKSDVTLNRIDSHNLEELGDIIDDYQIWKSKVAGEMEPKPPPKVNTWIKSQTHLTLKPSLKDHIVGGDKSSIALSQSEVSKTKMRSKSENDFQYYLNTIPIEAKKINSLRTVCKLTGQKKRPKHTRDNRKGNCRKLKASNAEKLLMDVSKTLEIAGANGNTEINLTDLIPMEQVKGIHFARKRKCLTIKVDLH